MNLDVFFLHKYEKYVHICTTVTNGSGRAYIEQRLDWTKWHVFFLVTKVQRRLPHELNANRLILNLVVSDKSVMHFMTDQRGNLFSKMRTFNDQTSESKSNRFHMHCIRTQPIILYRFKQICQNGNLYAFWFWYIFFFVLCLYGLFAGCFNSMGRTVCCVCFVTELSNN